MSESLPVEGPGLEIVEETIVGKDVVEEYAHIKAAILSDQRHTLHEGRVTIVKDSLEVQEAENVLDKVRGGRLSWDEHLWNQPLTHVDDDPMTFDRISLERIVKSDRGAPGHSSIIFTETTETLDDGAEHLVIVKHERYTQERAEGVIVGERYAKVTSPEGHLVESFHRRSRTPVRTDHTSNTAP